MAWRRKSHGEGMELVLCASVDGLMAEGPPGAVERLAQTLSGVPDLRLRRSDADAIGMTGSAVAMVRAHREYVQFSAQSLERPREFVAAPGSDGFYKMLVRDRKVRRVADQAFSQAARVVRRSKEEPQASPPGDNNVGPDGAAGT